jgi:hypothetical protein
MQEIAGRGRLGCRLGRQGGLQWRRPDRGGPSPTDPANVSRVDLVYPVGTMHLVGMTVGVSSSVDPHSCLFRATTQEQGHIEGGTGLFANAAGSFTGSVSPKGLLARNPDGSCAGNHCCTNWTWSSSAERCRSDRGSNDEHRCPPPDIADRQGAIAAALDGLVPDARQGDRRRRRAHGGHDGPRRGCGKRTPGW